LGRTVSNTWLIEETFGTPRIIFIWVPGDIVHASDASHTSAFEGKAEMTFCGANMG